MTDDYSAERYDRSPGMYPLDEITLPNGQTVVRDCDCGACSSRHAFPVPEGWNKIEAGFEKV